MRQPSNQPFCRRLDGKLRGHPSLILYQAGQDDSDGPEHAPVDGSMPRLQDHRPFLVDQESLFTPTPVSTKGRMVCFAAISYLSLTLMYQTHDEESVMEPKSLSQSNRISTASDVSGAAFLRECDRCAGLFDATAAL